MNVAIFRSMALAFVVSTFCGCHGREYIETAAQARREHPGARIILAVGDSLTAGYGVREEQAYPAQLEKKLRQAGYRWRVINAGKSGETTRGTLSRIDELVKVRPDIVILETGANDGLEGVDPRLTQRNIEETVRILKEHDISVILAGMRMPARMGQDRIKAFAEIYPAIASKYKIVLIPFFLAGVAGDAALNLPDGLHPAAEGYRIISDVIYPYVLQAIAALREAEP